MKRNIGLYFIVGLALFSMLFGSGNLIFPPEIGITGGTEWYLGYIAYFLADAVLSICSVFAMLKVDGDLNRLTGTIGPTGSMIINTVCIICIGPLLAIPRNAAVTFEMGISPLFGLDPESRILRLVFSIIFFGVVLLLTMICVSTTMMAVVSERRREIGLRKALGASDNSIRSEFLGEGLFLGLLGGVLGAILGFVFAQVVSVNVFHASIMFRPLLLPVTVLVSMAIAAASCLMPIKRAVAIDPALVLKGE